MSSKQMTSSGPRWLRAASRGSALSSSFASELNAHLYATIAANIGPTLIA